MRFRTGDRVIVLDHSDLPRDIVGKVGTVKVKRKSSSVFSSPGIHAVLDFDKDVDFSERWFGYTTKEASQYLKHLTKLDKALE